MRKSLNFSELDDVPEIESERSTKYWKRRQFWKCGGKACCGGRGDASTNSVVKRQKKESGRENVVKCKTCALWRRKKAQKFVRVYEGVTESDFLCWITGKESVFRTREERSMVSTIAKLQGPEDIRLKMMTELETKETRNVSKQQMILIGEFFTGLNKNKQMMVSISLLRGLVDALDTCSVATLVWEWTDWHFAPGKTICLREQLFWTRYDAPYGKEKSKTKPGEVDVLRKNEMNRRNSHSNETNLLSTKLLLSFAGQWGTQMCLLSLEGVGQLFSQYASGVTSIN